MTDSAHRHPSLSVTRRAMLGGLGAALALGNTELAFGATGNDPRLIVLNIRGGLDGLATVIPYGDPDLAGLRASLVPTGFNTLDGFFGLHPMLANLYAMYTGGEALMVHAVGPFATARSHFAGQNFLQSGVDQLLPSGWLNRVLAQFSPANGAVPGLVVGTQTPLLVQGPTLVNGWSLDPFAATPPTLMAQLTALVASDPLLGPALLATARERAAYSAIMAPVQLPPVNDLVQLATIAGSLLAAPNGPRVAALQSDSVDTHDDQNQRLPGMLTTIDNALGALKTTLGSAWSSTVVMTMTEFGRTAYVNGTAGSDHGTGYAVLLAGGAVRGGRVVCPKWPGLSHNKLFQRRDLAVTTDFRAIAMGVLIDHLGIPAAAQSSIFPASGQVVPMMGLVG